MASGANKLLTGSYVGTGVAFTYEGIGFWPRSIRVINGTDGSEVFLTDYMAQHPTVASRGGMKVNGADGVRSFLPVAEGLSAVTAVGFDVGTDAAVNTDGVKYFYTATN